MPEGGENPVNAQQAARILGGEHGPWARSTMSAIKRAMNITGRWLYVSDVRKFLHDNPDFRTTDVYRNKTHGYSLRVMPQRGRFVVTVRSLPEIKVEGEDLVEVMTRVAVQLKESISALTPIAARARRGGKAGTGL